MIAIGPVEGFRRRALTACHADGVTLVVILTQDGLKVIENRCPHQQTDRLHEGTIDANGLTCPLHGRTFDLSDGTCRNGDGRLTFLATDVRDGVLWVSLPEAPTYSNF